MLKAFLVRLVLFTSVLTLSFPALAQSTATIQGTVADQSGAVVTGAKVILRNQGTGAEREAITDSKGAYQVAGLPVGVYRVEVRADGFQAQVINDVTLEVSQTAVQNFQLKVGGVAQEVTITGDAPVLETTTVTVGQVINSKTVQEIPLNGRHFVDLGLLIPGSVTPPQNGFLTAPLRGQGSFAFNTAGNREDTVNFMINGVNLNDMVQNQITFQPSINTVQEFKVDNSTFSAEFGRNSGAIVNIATRSGTNNFHGEAFEFFRNDVLDAANFFDLKKPPFKRNQFGAALGGPIVKDKTFFFFSYEGLRQRQGLTVNSNVLTDQQRNSITDPVIKNLVALLPHATSVVKDSAGKDLGKFQGSATAPVNLDQWTLDVSQSLGKDDRLHGYYAIQRDMRGEPTLQGNTVPNFGDTRESRRQIFTLNETHTFGPRLVNEARFGYNRIFITFTPNNQMNPADLGIHNGINEDIGLPQVTVGGLGMNFGGPAGFPQGRGDTAVVFSDSASYLRGIHSLKFGGEFRSFYNNNFNRNIGTFGFASADTFILGNGNSFNVTIGDVSNAIVTRALGLFVQDSIKLRPNLTIEVGLRDDYFMSPKERFDRFVNFDPKSGTLVRVGDSIDEIYEAKHNWQPRVGFVWDPFKDGKTSVRAGYSILADQPVTNLITPLSANPPLATPLTFTGPVRLESAIITALDPRNQSPALAPAAVNEDFHNSYIQSWNLNIQREITPTLGVMVGYFGSKGTNLRLSRNLNQLVHGVRPFLKIPDSSPISPGKGLGNITEVDHPGNSSYNALWLTVNKRLSKGFQFNASYTFSKSLDFNSLNSQGVVVQDSNNVRGDYGLSDFDARHRFVVSAIYELPFKGNRLVEGWQVTTIAQLQSGNPVNLFVGTALQLVPGAAAGSAFGQLNGTAFTGVATLRPDVLGPIVVTGTPNQWFSNKVCDPRLASACPAGSTFALPVSVVGNAAVGHFGNLGRNVIIGPDFKNLDFSVLKTTKITESVRLQFRTEFFDLFNHPNFGQPGRVVQQGSATFGVIQNTRFPTGDFGSSRQVQFALKLIF
ncbi:MAG TPA: carboxypeptidase regulatory-like domain-containing protein [Blastocatellia bacterium]|nr:carboxypeptidase regulatory-like domain-containing protein [Blastocatellia bacterium]